jgi:hypothetical protein
MAHLILLDSLACAGSPIADEGEAMLIAERERLPNGTHPSL